MDEWQLAAGAMLVLLAPCGWVCVRRELESAIVAAQLAATLVTLALLLIAEAERREPFGDLAVVLAVMSSIGTLVFARYLQDRERR